MEKQQHTQTLRMHNNMSTLTNFW